MKKRKLFLSAVPLLFFMGVNGQVGINNTAPKATLEINAKNTTGGSSVVEGLIIPRVDRQRVQSMTGIPESTLIYVNSIATGTATGPTVNINQTGYYYFNGTQWQRFNDEGVAPLTKVAFNGSGLYNSAIIPFATVTKMNFPNINIAIDPDIGTWNTTTNEMTVSRKGVFTVSASLLYENIATTTNANLTVRAGNESESTSVLFATQGAGSPGATGPYFQRSNITSIFVLNPGDKIWIEADRSNEAWSAGKRTLNITFSEVN